MIYLLTAIGLSPSGSTNLHTNNTENNTNKNRTTQITTNVEECGPCPVFASFTLAFALQLRKKHGETSVRVRKTSFRIRKTSVRVCRLVLINVLSDDCKTEINLYPVDGGSKLLRTSISIYKTTQYT